MWVRRSHASTRAALLRRWIRPQQLRFSSTETPTETSGESQEATLEDEQTQAMLREATRAMSFTNPAQTALSPEMRQKLNAEFDKFIQEFVYDVDLSHEHEQYVVGSLSTASGLDLGSTTAATTPGNLKGFQRFPHLQRTQFDAPYSTPELYARQLFHAQRVAGLGAGIADSSVYRPHEDVTRPATKPSIAKLLAAGAHLGHATARVRANALPFVWGVRDGIHIIDLEQTLTALRRACRVVQGISERGGVILFVGTRQGQERTVVAAAKRSHGYYVHTRWTPGTLTNAASISGEWPRQELDMADKPTGRNLGAHLQKTIVKPDVCIVLNPVENRYLLKECIAARVPTIGIVDTDSEPSLVTYPVPGNDDSLRFSDLVAGILSNAAKNGRELRLKEVQQHAAAREVAQSGQGFNRQAPPPADFRLSEEEAQLAKA